MKKIFSVLVLSILFSTSYATNHIWDSRNGNVLINDQVFGPLKAGDTIFIPPFAIRGIGYRSASYTGLDAKVPGSYIVVYWMPGSYINPSAYALQANFLDGCAGLKIVGCKMNDIVDVFWRLGPGNHYSSYIWLDSCTMRGMPGMGNFNVGRFPDFNGDTSNMFHHWKWTNCLFDSLYSGQSGGIAISLGAMTSNGYWRDVEIGGCVFDHYSAALNASNYIDCTNAYNVSIHNNIFRNLGMANHPVGHAAVINYAAGKVDIYNNIFGPDNFGNDIRGRNTDLLKPGYMGRGRIYNNISFNKRKYAFLEVQQPDVSALKPYVRRRTAPEVWNITCYNMSVGSGNTVYQTAIVDCYITDTVSVKNSILIGLRDTSWNVNLKFIFTNSTGRIRFVDTAGNRLVKDLSHSGVADNIYFKPRLKGLLHNAGVPVPSYITTDVYNNPRSSGGKVDIGAVELQTDEPVKRK
jgi:hypothetical protein